MIITKCEAINLKVTYLNGKAKDLLSITAIYQILTQITLTKTNKCLLSQMPGNGEGGS